MPERVCPYTADEVLEQINDAVSYYTKKFNKYTREFKKVLDQGGYDTLPPMELIDCMPKLNVLNFARISVTRAKNGRCSLEESFEAIKSWCFSESGSEGYEDVFYALQYDNRTHFMSFIDD